jgi:hypothetical protein
LLLLLLLLLLQKCLHHQLTALAGHGRQRLLLVLKQYRQDLQAPLTLQG